MTFANNGKAMHTVTAGNGSFDSDMIKSGGTWAHTFTTAGIVHLRLHPAPEHAWHDQRRQQRQQWRRRRSPDRAPAKPARSTGADSRSDGAAATATATDTAIQPVNIDVADNEFNPNRRQPSRWAAP